MLLGAVYNIEASKSPFLPNFEVIVDTSSSRNKKLLSNLRRYDSILSVNTESSEGSGKAAVERIRCEAVHIAGKILDEARVVVENVQAERKGVMKNIRHCSKLDICLYVAFAYVLTTTVKSKSELTFSD